MARRMISDEVVGNDKFLEMSKAAQLLYFHLVTKADDDGFCSSPRSVMAVTKTKMRDLNELENNGFVIVFDSGVLVITHWFIMNIFDHANRKKKTTCKAEVNQIHQTDAKVWERNAYNGYEY